MSLLDTTEASERLVGLGVNLSKDEVADLARMGVFGNSALKSSGRWLISSTGLEEYVQRLNNPTSSLKTESVNYTEAANRLGVGIEILPDLCKFGYLPNSFQYYPDGPWHINEEDLENLLQEEKDLNRIPSWRDHMRYWVKTNRLKAVIGLLVTMLGLIFGLISAGADFGGARQQFVEWGIIRAFPEAKDGEVLIVIASFYHPEGVADVEIHGELRNAIKQTAENFGIDDLRVEVEPTRIRATETSKAIDLGQRYNADIVIWGEDTGVRISVVFQGLRPKNPELAELPHISEWMYAETEATQFNSPTLFSSFVTKDLPTRLSFISLFSNSYAAHLAGSKEQAIELVIDATNLLDENVDSVETIATTYYAIAELYLWDPSNDVSSDQEDIASAIRYLDKVIELDPNGRFVGDRGYERRAVAYTQIGDWDRVQEDFKEACMIRYPEVKESSCDTSGLAWRMMSRNSVGDDQGVIDDAAKLNEMEEAQICLANRFAAVSHTNLARSAMQESDLERAIYHFSGILDLPRDCDEGESGSVDLQMEVGFAALARGSWYDIHDQPDLALSDYRLFLDIAKKYPDSRTQNRVNDVMKRVDEMEKALED